MFKYLKKKKEKTLRITSVKWKYFFLFICICDSYILSYGVKLYFNKMAIEQSAEME